MCGHILINNHKQKMDNACENAMHWFLLQFFSSSFFSFVFELTRLLLLNGRLKINATKKKKNYTIYRRSEYKFCITVERVQFSSLSFLNHSRILLEFAKFFLFFFFVQFFLRFYSISEKWTISNEQFQWAIQPLPLWVFGEQFLAKQFIIFLLKDSLQFNGQISMVIEQEKNDYNQCSVVYPKTIATTKKKPLIYRAIHYSL